MIPRVFCFHTTAQSKEDTVLNEGCRWPRRCHPEFYLDEFLPVGLGSPQFSLDHSDEVSRSIFRLNVAETSFFEELREGK